MQDKLANPKPKEQAIPHGRRVVDLLDAFLNSVEIKKISPRTQYNYARNADAIRWKHQTQAERSAKTPRIDEEFGLQDVRHIGKPEVKMFSNYFEKARGENMARAVIGTLSSAYAWATMSPDWRLTENPCSRLKLDNPEPLVVI